LVQFPSSEILFQAIKKTLAAGGSRGFPTRESLLQPAKTPPGRQSINTTKFLQSISQAFGGEGRLGGTLPGLTEGQFQFLVNERVQKFAGQIELQQAQQVQQKAELDFLAKIQGAIDKQLESFKVPQIEAPTIDLTPMIESESQVKQEQPSSSIIPLAILGAVLLG